ncbi:YajG family lipoprotein [Caulobacter sp. BE254]|uniref:YajG family lipoprotein n=1 Tax=Caulobacter sp. BE254 TaxID=2817720 RepID=UPI0028576F5E|nr:YajG family lipoprotein [Caulobacter sp. BE254]MDR7116372.1 putative lipoprotein [Caulobacter sp. BE254]
MRILAIVALAAAVTACATTEETVPVGYVPAPASAQPGAEAIQVTVTAVDARTTNRARISTKMNGYGMEMAPIRSKEEVADIVRDALSAEFKQRGYKLAAGGPKVEAKVATFYSQYGVGILAGKAVATADLTVTVTSPSGAEVYKRVLNGKSEKSVQIFNGKNAAAALSAALADDFKTLFADEAFTKALAAQ